MDSCKIYADVVSYYYTFRKVVKGRYMKRKLEFENVMFRLKKALGISNDKELCVRLGLTPSAFSNRKGTNSIPYEHVIELARSEKLNLHWVFWDEGQPRVGDDAASLPFDLGGALIDEALMGAVCISVEREFVSNADLLSATGMHEIWEFYRAHRHNMDEESNRKLVSLLEEERIRLLDEAGEKGMAAASIYNNVVQKRSGKDIKLLKPFLDEEVSRYIKFLKLLKSRQDLDM